MLNRLKTAATGSSSGVPGDSGSADSSGRWSRKSSKTAERDQFRVQQQGFYVRGDLTVDIFQARGLRTGPAGDRNTYCVVLVDRERVGETSTAPKTLSPVWNHPVKVAHEHVRRAADMNVWPVPYQPLSIQVWDRSNSSDTLLGTARVPITDNLGNGDANGWHRLVGTGCEQAGAEELCGKIRIKVHWESQSFARSPEDEPRFFLRDVFGHDDKDYQHLYYGGLSSTLLAPPAGEEVLLEMMSSISRHDISASGHGKGVEGMLVLTELRLLFLPDISRGSATASYLEFHTVQVYLAAVRNFSHRGLEGGSRLLSITTRDGRFVHFRMPAMASSARCGAWFDAECSRRRVPGSAPGSGGEELWKRGLWGAGSSEQWMERLADEIRWRKAHGDFVALWHKVCETSSSLRATVTAVARAASNAAAAAAAASNSAVPAGFYRGGGGVGGGGGMNPSSSAAASAAQHHHGVPIGGSFGARVAGCGGGVSVASLRGDAADGWAALERDLERVGVPPNGSGYAGFGRQMWEFKRANKDYGLSPTYPQVLAFPSSLTPAQLAAAAPQRSRSRVPALVWLHPASKAPLVRSSQPMAGMTTKVLSEDIHLLKQIRVTLDATKISIVDARSLLNAKANQVTGKGYEDVNDIGRDVATLNFMGIENIHSVRDSLAAYCSASQAQGQEFYHAVGASGWLRHLSQIMKGAAFVVDELQRGVAVLVHCSDGWDRTAQLTALAQLYLDPYYRTLEGFEVLVEKEWGSFGHMFGMRAHSDSPTESSPVFLQWLDAVWQLLRQYPSSFEFTGHYLERLVEGLYSAAFINFSGNCERERKDKLKDLHAVGSGAVSLFVYLREHAMEGHMTAPLLNALYRPPRQGASGGRGPSVRTVDVLRPCCELQGLEIWQAVFMRDNLLLHHREHQMSVEQGLRLQVYDYKRRMDMVESQIDRLPRGLKMQLQSSATGMSSPEWDGHRRLTDQLSADQDAAAAAAAAGASASASASTSASIIARGRSQSRAARSGNADEGSRSRSRSFTIPIRGWGSGNKAGNNTERRQRWASQEWDPPRGRQEYDIEEEVGQYGPSGGGGGGSESSGPTTTTTSGGYGGGGRAAEEDLGERPARGKSLFGFGGRGSGNLRGGGGGALSRLTPAVVNRPTPGMGESSDESEEEDSTAGDPRAGRGKGIESIGRRRATSMAGIGGGGDGSKSRNSRFSSFSGERPSSSVAPPMDAALGLGNAAQTAVTFNPVTEVQGRDDGSSRMGRSRSMVDPRLPPEVARVLQQREATNFPPRKKGWGRGRASSSAGAMGDERQQQQQTQRRVSSAGAQQEEFADERMARRGSRLASQAMYAAGSSSMGSDSNVGGGGKGGLWPFSRNKKRGSGAVGGGVGRPGGVPKADVKKGVWGSLQRTLGGSSKQPTSHTVPVQGRSPHHFQQPAVSQGQGSAVARATAAAARREKAAKSLARAADENDANSAARLATRLKAEEDAESRRQMQHTIATLEVQLLVKDIVDSACARVAERASEKSSERSSEPSNRSAPPSVSSSTAPAPHPRLSATALQAERPTFFGTFWGGGDTGGGTSNGTSNGTGNGGGGVTGQWGGQERPAGEREVRRHTTATDMGEPYGGTIWRGTMREAAPGAGRKAGGAGRGGGVFPEEEESFFQSLRRKIFEGDSQQVSQREAEAEASREAAAAIAAAVAASAVATPGPEPPSEERSTKRSGPGEGVSPSSSKALSTPSAMQAALRYTPVRSSERGESHGSPSFGLDSTGSFSTRLTSNGSSTPAGVRLARPIRAPSSSGAGAGPGTGGYSPIITIPTTHGTDTPPPQHPDAGAGGIRPVDRVRASSIPVMHMAPDVAEEAAAKFGLVRMVFGDVGQ